MPVQTTFGDHLSRDIHITLNTSSNYLLVAVLITPILGPRISSHDQEGIILLNMSILIIVLIIIVLYIKKIL